MDTLLRNFEQRHPTLPLLDESVEKAITSSMLDIWNLAQHEPEIVVREEDNLYFADVVDMNAQDKIIFSDEGEGSIDELAAIQSLQERLESRLNALYKEKYLIRCEDRTWKLGTFRHYNEKAQQIKELVSKIWRPQIIIGAHETDADLVVAHICDSQGGYLMKFDSTPQKSRGIAMDHLIEQLKRKHEELTKATSELKTS